MSSKTRVKEVLTWSSSKRRKPGHARSATQVVMGGSSTSSSLTNPLITSHSEYYSNTGTKSFTTTGDKSFSRTNSTSSFSSTNSSSSFSNGSSLVTSSPLITKSIHSQIFPSLQAIGSSEPANVFPICSISTRRRFSNAATGLDRQDFIVQQKRKLLDVYEVIGSNKESIEASLKADPKSNNLTRTSSAKNLEGGQGAFGTVFPIKHRITGQKRACKRIDLAAMRQSIEDIEFDEKFMRQLEESASLTTFKSVVAQQNLEDEEKKDDQVQGVSKSSSDGKTTTDSDNSRNSIIATGNNSITTSENTDPSIIVRSLSKQILRARSRLERAFVDKLIRNEIENMISLDHPHICNLYTYFWDEPNNSVFLILDLLEGPDLFDRMQQVFSGEGNSSAETKDSEAKDSSVVLNRQKKPNAAGMYPFSETEASLLLRHMLKGLFGCHSRGVVHQDVKPENFMFSNQNLTNLKIIDLGLSVRNLTVDKTTGVDLGVVGGSGGLGTTQGTATQGAQQGPLAGSVAYMAPERLINLGADNRKCDIWSTGLILYMLLTAEPLFSLNPLHEQRVQGEILNPSYVKRKIRDAKRRYRFSDDANDILLKMLQRDPEKRYDAKQCLEHSFILKNYHILLGDNSSKSISAFSTHEELFTTDEILFRLETFASLPLLKRASLKILAHMLGSSKTLEKARHSFRQLDVDGSGSMSKEEFLIAMRRERKRSNTNPTTKTSSNVAGDVRKSMKVSELMNAAKQERKENLASSKTYGDATSSSTNGERRNGNREMKKKKSVKLFTYTCNEDEKGDLVCKVKNPDETLYDMVEIEDEEAVPDFNSLNNDEDFKPLYDRILSMSEEEIAERIDALWPTIANSQEMTFTDFLASSLSDSVLGRSYAMATPGIMASSTSVAGQGVLGTTSSFVPSSFSSSTIFQDPLSTKLEPILITAKHWRGVFQILDVANTGKLTETILREKFHQDPAAVTEITYLFEKINEESLAKTGKPKNYLDADNMFVRYMMRG